jgi:hypothetical protein
MSLGVQLVAAPAIVIQVTLEIVDALAAGVEGNEILLQKIRDKNIECQIRKVISLVSA